MPSTSNRIVLESNRPFNRPRNRISLWLPLSPTATGGRVGCLPRQRQHIRLSHLVSLAYQNDTNAKLPRWRGATECPVIISTLSQLPQILCHKENWDVWLHNAGFANNSSAFMLRLGIEDCDQTSSLKRGRHISLKRGRHKTRDTLAARAGQGW